MIAKLKTFAVVHAGSLDANLKYNKYGNINAHEIYMLF